MSGLFGGGSKPQTVPLPPPLPAAPPTDINAPEAQAAGAAERLRLRQRKGRSSTILTGGALLAPEATGEAGTLLGGGARR